MSGFDTTRWSLVLHARNPSGAREALESLCRTYRPPVLAYVRRHGYSADAAEDLVQAFFVRFIENAYHAHADPARGRFRAFLLTAVKRFLIDSNEESHRLKRGGAMRFESTDSAGASVIAGDDDPESAFEREWAMAILDSALGRLRTEAAAVGKLPMFEKLSEFLVERPDDSDYERLATSLGLRRNTIAVAVHRMRHRLRELVREEIGQTAASAGELAHELQDLRSALAGTLN
jgi:RNA polymerase sigma factor (sigma-70 family)